MSAGRTRVNLADLQRAAAGADKVRVAAALLGVPAETYDGPTWKGYTVDEIYAEYPSPWLGASADSRYQITGRDLRDELIRVVGEVYTDELQAEDVRIAVDGAIAGMVPVTPMEKVVSRAYREILRDMGGKHTLRKSRATSMKKNPRSWGRPSAVVITNRDGDMHDENGDFLSYREADALLAHIPTDEEVEAG